MSQRGQSRLQLFQGVLHPSVTSSVFAPGNFSTTSITRRRR